MKTEMFFGRSFRSRLIRSFLLVSLLPLLLSCILTVRLFRLKVTRD